MSDEILSILELPDHFLVSATKHLSFSDILSFRLTCFTFYNLSYCNEIIQRFCIRFKKLRNQSYLKTFLERAQFGKNITLCIDKKTSNITSKEDFKYLVKYYTKCLRSINVSYTPAFLDIVSTECSSIEQVNLTCITCYHGKRINMTIECLQRFQQLKTLTITQTNLTTSQLNRIVVSSKILVDLSLSSVVVQTQDDNFEKLQENILKAKHITNWKLNHFEIYESSGYYRTLHLPSTVKCLYLMGDPKHVAGHFDYLENFTIDKCHVASWENIQYDNIQNLTLIYPKFYSNNNIQLPVHSTIEVLTIIIPLNLSIYLQSLLKLGPEVKLKTLILQSHDEHLFDLQLCKQLSSFKNLQCLELWDITLETFYNFVEKILPLKAPALTYIILQNGSTRQWILLNK